MNQRISELLKKAGFPTITTSVTLTSYEPMERLTELIIKECVREFVRKTPVSVNVSNRARHVFKHFGIKE